MNLKETLKSLDSVTYLSLLNRFSEILSKELTFPEWFNFVKTGVHRERLPDNPNWMYVRAAAVLIYCLHTPRSVKSLRLKYGGMRNRGSAPDKKYLASGSIHRKMVQELQAKDYLFPHIKGRVSTEKTRKIISELL